LRRAGGRPGDLICVSGTPGDAAAGLALLAPDAREGFGDPISRAALRARFEYPTPRLELGRQLLDIASACIDVSDGLAGDLGKLAAASGCAAVLDLERVPRSEALATLVREGVFDEREALSFMLAGGDDYELAFTVPPENREALSELEARGEVFVIGTLVEAKASEPLVTVRTERTELKPYLDALPSSYDHFNHA